MSDDREVKTLVKEIRRQCEKRGWGSLKAMSVLFRGLDKDYSKRVDLREFIDGMRNYGIDMTEEQLGKVFRWCDKDHGGSIDFREFLQELLPPMAPCRKAVIEEVFRKLDATKDGVLKMDDLKSRFSSIVTRFWSLFSFSTEGIGLNIHLALVHGYVCVHKENQLEQVYWVDYKGFICCYFLWLLKTSLFPTYVFVAGK